VGWAGGVGQSLAILGTIVYPRAELGQGLVARLWLRLKTVAFWFCASFSLVVG
jgi:hypothetical protein